MEDEVFHSHNVLESLVLSVDAAKALVVQDFVPN